MKYYGKLTKREYSSETERNHYERNERMRRNGEREDKELAPLYEMPLEEFKKLCRKADQTNLERQEYADSGNQVEVWVESHPEYIDNDHNTALMQASLQSRGIKFPKGADLEDTYDFLRANNALQLKPDVLRRQHQAAIRKQADEVEARGGFRGVPHTEEEMRAMSLEELRQASNAARG